MVEDYKNKYEFNLSYFIKNNIDSDFYVIKESSRKLINDDKTLNLFLKQSKDVRIIIDKGDILGVVGIWKVIEDNIRRDYIKINATDKNIFERLITVVVWNTKNTVLIKVKKDYKFMNILRNKGFDFVSSNNQEIIFSYCKFKKRE